MCFKICLFILQLFFSVLSQNGHPKSFGPILIGSVCNQSVRINFSTFQKMYFNEIIVISESPCALIKVCYTLSHMKFQVIFSIGWIIAKLTSKRSIIKVSWNMSFRMPRSPLNILTNRATILRRTNSDWKGLQTKISELKVFSCDTTSHENLTKLSFGLILLKSK